MLIVHYKKAPAFSPSLSIVGRTFRHNWPFQLHSKKLHYCIVKKPLHFTLSVSPLTSEIFDAGDRCIKERAVNPIGSFSCTRRYCTRQKSPCIFFCQSVNWPDKFWTPVIGASKNELLIQLALVLLHMHFFLHHHYWFFQRHSRKLH